MKVSSLYDRLKSRLLLDAKRPKHILEKETARKLLLDDFQSDKVSLDELLVYLSSHVAKNMRFL